LLYNVTSREGRKSAITAEVQQTGPKMAFSFNAKAWWQRLKVFFDRDCPLLYRVFANALIKESTNKNLKTLSVVFTCNTEHTVVQYCIAFL